MMSPPVRHLLPLLLVLAAACAPERPPSALAVVLELPVAADCVRVEATVPGAREVSTVTPAAGEAPKLRYVVAVYPGGSLGAGAVALRATGHLGGCDAEPFLSARADSRFPSNGVTGVTLTLKPVSADSDGDGVPDDLDCAPSDARRFPRTGPEQGCGNGLDDDCDGLAEDGCPCSAPRGCYPDDKRANAGVGACTLGTQACMGGVYGTECTGAVLPAPETCDDVDNDCDGVVDPPGCPCESGATRSCYEKGPPLDAGVGICTRGLQACMAGSWLGCTGDVAPEPERCNGLDDDCDGQVDERPDVSTAPCALQAGVCAGALLACGASTCGPSDYTLVAAGRGSGYVATEGTSQCDGFDNDCDGEVDEGCPCSAGASEPCHPLGLSFEGLDAGLCRVGARTCQLDGGWGDCTGAVSPVPERCNGKDDDCDGAVDDSPADAGTPCPAQGLGVCSVGTWACTQGALVCGGVPTASAELCNGLDDDCNGAADEPYASQLGLPCDAGIGECARSGSVSCQPDGTAACNVQAAEPRAELCNGKDDDCDGAPDEDFSGLNTLCTLGDGGCLRSGTIVCLSDGGSGCNAEIVPPVQELCNGRDDDCDGALDEDFSGLDTLCVVGTGACQRNGTLTCYPDGGSGCSQEPGLPAVETCNGVDEDCDGVADNNIPGVGTTPCSLGVGACQRTGVVTCAGGVTGCSVTAGTPGRETCNGVDDDCNGQTDERPACGGPRTDFAENAAQTWGAADPLTLPQPYTFCGITGQNYVGLVTSTLYIRAGNNSTRLNYGTSGSKNGTASFVGIYPVTRNAGWDLTSSGYSVTQGITFAAGDNLPAGVTWATNLPVVVLCSASGGYRTYSPTFQSVGYQSWIISSIPIGGNATWTATTVGNFDLSNVSSVEFHFQPSRNNVAGQMSVWLDDVKFY
ncbi:MAG: hypothetical protein RL653_4146 [Pseudomonadota bacterium]|jgi:hypothetical protein